MKYYLVSLMILVCGQVEGKSSMISAPADIRTYVNQFMLDSMTYGYNLPFRELTFAFDSTPSGDNPDRIGYCKRTGPWHYSIVIDKDTWDASERHAREVLIYHELGHCWLNRPHWDECFETIGSQCHVPYSIMHSIAVSAIVWHTYRNEYLLELFKGVKPRFR